MLIYVKNRENAAVFDKNVKMAVMKFLFFNFIGLYLRIRFKGI